MKKLVAFLALSGCVLGTGWLAADEEKQPGSEVPTYWQDVRPILRKHCTVCHSTKNLREVDVSGGLALDSYEAVLKGKKLPIVKKGNGRSSKLVRVLTTTDEDRVMPRGAKRLPDATIDVIRRWIDHGAREGKKPENVDLIVKTGPSRRRKLDVSLPTTAVPPAGYFGKLRPGQLELVLKAGPLAPVTAVVFSPDGKFLATGAYGRVTVWDLTSVRPAKVLTNVLGAVNDIRFSPDGKLLAVAGGQPSAKGDLRLYETGTWKLLATLDGHEDVVFSVSFDPAGQKLASASFDKTVRLWDVSRRKLLHTFTGHSDFVYAVDFSADGKWVASASKDRTVKVVEAETGQSRFTFSGMNEDVLAVAFTPDGKYVVSSGFESRMYWWNLKTGQRERLQAGHGGAVHEIQFSKDGQIAVSASADKTVRVWNGASGAAQATINVGAVVYAVALRNDKSLIATGSYDGLVRLWDVRSRRHLLTLLSLPPEKDGYEWLAYTPTGILAGTSGLAKVGQWRMNGSTVDFTRVWDALAQPQALVKALRGENIPPPQWK
ncbi:MAG: hypothetical protein KatS3mg105_4216 [Gemmatales bacterium]|nr:MAG: hypothetical protein KatS3mg105_4216 [Gemmatales bacterium]